MKIPTSWKVTPEHGPRPAGKPDECFYCNAPVGDMHRSGCVLRRKRVMVRLTIEYPLVVPEHWTADDVNYSRNEGSWCASNLVAELERLNGAVPCLCDLAEYEYLRDATVDDIRLPEDA